MLKSNSDLIDELTMDLTQEQSAIAADHSRGALAPLNPQAVITAISVQFGGALAPPQHPGGAIPPPNVFGSAMAPIIPLGGAIAPPNQKALITANLVQLGGALAQPQHPGGPIPSPNLFQGALAPIIPLGGALAPPAQDHAQVLQQNRRARRNVKQSLLILSSSGAILPPL